MDERPFLAHSRPLISLTLSILNMIQMTVLAHGRFIGEWQIQFKNTLAVTQYISPELFYANAR